MIFRRCIAGNVGEAHRSVSNASCSISVNRQAFRWSTPRTPAPQEPLHFVKAGSASNQVSMTWRSVSASSRMGRGLLGGGASYPGNTERRELWARGPCRPCSHPLGMEHTRKYGTTFEQFAKVSVKNHHHSTLNDKAMYRFETPLKQVMEAEMISHPLTKPDVLRQRGRCRSCSCSVLMRQGAGTGCHGACRASACIDSPKRSLHTA